MKKFIVGCFVSLTVVAAQASYLYWQVDSSDYSGGAFSAAQITMVNGATQVGTVGESFALDIGSVQDGSFYIELMNYQNGQWSAVAQSDTMTYAQLSASITSELEDVGRVTPWHGSNYRAVPEPTSGVLMIVGLALLGLKRRKA